MPMEMPSPSASSASGEIVISDFRFAVPAAVSPGEQITIRNEDTAEHSVTADSGDAFDVDVDGGESVTMIVPSSAGAYAFHCEYHPNMIGTLTVS
nr:cupredoxin domain-containing protein [Rhodococcus sp. (in: high G+C Gram-positive bacteria)]